MTDVAWPATLECGTSPEVLLASAADHEDPVTAAHAATCPHCGAALRLLSPGLAVMRVTAQMPAQVPSRIERQVVARIRRLRAGTSVEIASDRGVTSVAEDVIVSVVTAAIDLVDGVRVSRVGVQAFGLALDLGVIVEGTGSIPERAAAVRHSVDELMFHHLAIVPARIDIMVTDIDLAAPA